MAVQKWALWHLSPWAALPLGGWSHLLQGPLWALSHAYSWGFVYFHSVSVAGQSNCVPRCRGGQDLEPVSGSGVATASAELGFAADPRAHTVSCLASPSGWGPCAPNRFTNQTGVGKSLSSFKKWLGSNQGNTVLYGQVVSWCFDSPSCLAAPAMRLLKATHCLAEVQHPTFAHWHIIVRLRRASHWLGGATGPVAAQEKAGRGHQQGACGILPEGVEDPSEGELGHYNEFRRPWGWETHAPW